MAAYAALGVGRTAITGEGRAFRIAGVAAFFHCAAAFQRLAIGSNALAVATSSIATVSAGFHLFHDISLI